MADDDGRRMKIHAAAPDYPSALLQKAAGELHDGDSPFSMLLVMGCYTIEDPRTGARYPQVAVASKLRKDRPEELRHLVAKLRQVLGDLEAIAAAGEQTPS